MNLLEFLERFPGEDDCLNYFIETRLKAGILCRKCGSDKHIWIAEINQFQCEKCGNQIGIKTGTTMENSKLPIKYWFLAIQLLTSSTEKFSMNEIQNKFGDADPIQVKKMLISLMSKATNSWSFDQLLFDCVVNSNQES